MALVDINGKTFNAHVKNTGRCRELLKPGAKVFLEDFTYRMGSRKLPYSLVAVEKHRGDSCLLVNMDSQAPNRVVAEALAAGTLILPGMNRLRHIKAECLSGDSRLDFYAEDESGQRAYIEVKGVTLEKNGVAMFPDAPTQRGIRHLYRLCAVRDEGFLSYVIFVIQMKGVRAFAPNDCGQPDFGSALREVSSKGVVPLAFECSVTPETLSLDSSVPIML